jgi:hypothetical protein
MIRYGYYPCSADFDNAVARGAHKILKEVFDGGYPKPPIYKTGPPPDRTCPTFGKQFPSPHVSITERPEEQYTEERPLKRQRAEEQPLREQPLREQPLREQPLREQPLREQPLREQPLREQNTVIELRATEGYPSPSITPAPPLSLYPTLSRIESSGSYVSRLSLPE